MGKRAWYLLGGLGVTAVAFGYGCGSSSGGGSGPGSDGGADATEEAGMDAEVDSSSSGADSSSSSSGADSSSSSGSSSGADSSSSSSGGDSGHADSSTSSGGDSSAADGPGFDGNLACTGTDTPCTYENDGGTLENGVCTSNVCGACLTDGACVTGYGAGHICVSGSCVPGNCHTTADCADGGAISVCVNNSCQACDTVTGGAYYVDPVNGSDGLGATGSDKAGGVTASTCAFKSITHALSVIGTPSSATTITVLNDDPAANETFPLVIPANVTVMGSSKTVNVNVGATMAIDGGTAPADGFVLGGANSGIASLTVTGITGAAAGIRAGAGSVATTTLKDVTVTGFATGDGVLVNGASSILTLDAGVVLTANLDGLHVTDTGTAVSSNTDQTDPDVFSANTRDGVLVDVNGTLTLTGSAGTLGVGSIIATGNTTAGCAFMPAQNQGNEPLSALTGFVSWANGAAADGLLLQGGTHIKVRSSYFVSNATGVHFTTNTTTANLGSTDAAGLDLGAAGDPGLNTLQIPSGTTNDGGAVAQNGAGLCVTIVPNQSQGLLARGNIWASSNGTASVNCSTTTAALSVLNTGCTGNVDLGGQGFTPGSQLSVYILSCTCTAGACQ